MSVHDCDDCEVLHEENVRLRKLLGDVKTGITFTLCHSEFPKVREDLKQLKTDIEEGLKEKVHV